MIGWLHEIWSNLNKQLFTDSCDYCRITSKNRLHTILKEMLSTNHIIQDNLVDVQESDEIDSFENNDVNLFEDTEEEKVIELNEIIHSDEDDEDDKDYLSNDSESKESYSSSSSESDSSES